MREIAEKAGVSVMTVSLALRSHARIPQATRDRVRAVAEREGYRPHPYVSALMASLRPSRHRGPDASATLAYVYNLPRPTLSSLVFMKALHRGIMRRAQQLGFGIDLFFRHELGPDRLHLDRVLKARGIRGVIIGPTHGMESGLDYELDWSHFALATIGFTLRSPQLHRAASFTYHSASSAHRELWRRGYRRIGLVNTPVMHYRVDGNWRAGHFEAQTELTGKVNPASVLMHEGHDAFMSWVRRYKPDAVLSNIGEEKEWLEAAGLRVPEDIGLATLSPLEPKRLPLFAGVDQRETALGMTAVDVVVEQLNNNSYGLPEMPRTVMIECTWREGPSVRSTQPTMP